MNSLVRGRLFFVRSFSIFQRATFATQQAVDPIQRAFVEKLREYQEKSKTAEMGLVGASETQVKELKDSLGKLDNVFNAKGVDMTQFPILQHKDPELINPGSSIVVEYPERELLEDNEKSERLDDVLTKGPIVI
nr:mitochondrial ATP synthase coupling factor 6 [Hymenolepis microstoma]